MKGGNQLSTLEMEVVDERPDIEMDFERVLLPLETLISGTGAWGNYNVPGAVECSSL